jgi:hypothetical protein
MERGGAGSNGAGAGGNVSRAGGTGGAGGGLGAGGAAGVSKGEVARDGASDHVGMGFSRTGGGAGGVGADAAGAPVKFGAGIAGYVCIGRGGAS